MNDCEIFACKLIAIWNQATATTDLNERQRLNDECFKLCELKQAELLKIHKESTVIKVDTPKYRKAIAATAGMLDPTLKGGYSYTSYPVAFWKVDQGLKNEIDSRTKIAVGNKKKDSTRISVECREKLLTLANDLLEIPVSSNKDIFRKALAISLLTGRRFYVEICRNAEFFPLDTVTDFNRVLGFIGQGKGDINKAQKVYELPCYAENIDLLISNTKLIQNFVKSKEWYRNDLDAQSFQSKIKSQCERALVDFQRIVLEYGFMITIKDLRALYMAFAYYDYKVLSGRLPDIDTYLGSIAGHDVETDQGTYYRVGTTEHYKGFMDERLDF